jgi:hypothetical protein
MSSNGLNPRICGTKIQRLVCRRNAKSQGQECIHILHTTPQAGLYAIGLPPENVHDKRPAETCKNRPCICSNLFSHL